MYIYEVHVYVKRLISLSAQFATPRHYCVTYTCVEIHEYFVLCFNTYTVVYMYEVYIYGKCLILLRAQFATLRHCRAAYVCVYIHNKILCVLLHPLWCTYTRCTFT